MEEQYGASPRELNESACPGSALPGQGEVPLAGTLGWTGPMPCPGPAPEAGPSGDVKKILDIVV